MSSYEKIASDNDASASNKGPIHALTGVFKSAVNFTKSGAKFAGQTMMASVDAVGLKDKVEAAEQAARKLAAKGRVDATKAVNKARRLATKALDFEEEEGSFDTADFDLLLSAAGAVEKNVQIHGYHSQTFVVPAGSIMVWKARVKHQDIGFSVKEESDIGITEHEPLQRFKSDSQIQGQIESSNVQRNITLTFDNSHSLQRKTIAYWIAIGENVSLSDDLIGEARSKEVAAAEEGPLELSSDNNVQFNI
eukprot:gene21510-27854_t